MCMLMACAGGKMLFFFKTTRAGLNTKQLNKLNNN